MLNWVSIAVSLADKILDHLPDKQERVINAYLEAKREYVEEMAKNYEDRSDARIDYLRMELFNSIQGVVTKLQR